MGKGNSHQALKDILATVLWWEYSGTSVGVLRYSGRSTAVTKVEVLYKSDYSSTPYCVPSYIKLTKYDANTY